MMTANGLFSKDGVREVSIDDICRINPLLFGWRIFLLYCLKK